MEEVADAGEAVLKEVARDRERPEFREEPPLSSADSVDPQEETPHVVSAVARSRREPVTQTGIGVLAVKFSPMGQPGDEYEHESVEGVSLSHRKTQQTGLGAGAILIVCIFVIAIVAEISYLLHYGYTHNIIRLP